MAIPPVDVSEGCERCGCSSNLGQDGGFRLCSRCELSSFSTMFNMRSPDLVHPSVHYGIPSPNRRISRRLVNLTKSDATLAEEISSRRIGSEDWSAPTILGSVNGHVIVGLCCLLWPGCSVFACLPERFRIPVARLRPSKMDGRN